MTTNDYARSIMPSISNPAARNYLQSYINSNGINFVRSSTAGSSFMSTGTSQLREGAPGGLSEEDSAVDAEEVEEDSPLEGSAVDAIPEMAIAQMAQKFGSGLNSIISGVKNYNINADYINTLSTGHGIGLQESAVNKATAQYAQSSLENLGGKFGAMFGGPIGMLAGRGIAKLFETPITNAVAYSPMGRFDPQQGTTPQSQSSRQPGADSTNEPEPVEMTTLTSNDNSNGNDTSEAQAETTL